MRVLLVVNDTGLFAAFVVDDVVAVERRAEQMARNIDGVVAEARVMYDGRKSTRRRRG